MAKYKYVNAFIEAKKEDTTIKNGVLLVFLDTKQKRDKGYDAFDMGGSTKFVRLKSDKAPQKSIVTQVREVTYLYKRGNEYVNEVVKETKGWEIVKEIFLDKSSKVVGAKPQIVESVTKTIWLPAEKKTYVRK